ncbi:hypothetical protein TNCV_2480821 [Trichonephila clavipes]|nr:hypothetical protein TNCV_2480821 [Trichonephila clavipes]
MCLADGQQSTSLVQKATVPITVGGRTFQIDLIFCHMQRCSLLVDDSPVEINSSSCPTNSIPSEIPLHSNTVDEEICELKTIIIDFPTRTANELRTEQLKDLELKR